MEFVVETNKGGIGKLGRGSSGDERGDGLEGFEGLNFFFLMESFGSIVDFPFDLGTMEDEGL